MNPQQINAAVNNYQRQTEKMALNTDLMSDALG
jgi:hypothetical protein